MLEELAIGQAALRGEAALEVSVLMVDHLRQSCITSRFRLLLQSCCFKGLGVEGVDCLPQFGCVDVLRGSVNDVSKVLVVRVHLGVVVDGVERKIFIGCDMVCQEC